MRKRSMCSDQLADAGAVACAGRESGLAYAVVRQSPPVDLLDLHSSGLLRLGVKRSLRVDAHRLTRPGPVNDHPPTNTSGCSERAGCGSKR